MDKRKRLILLMFLVIGIAMAVKMILWWQPEKLPAEDQEQHEPLLPVAEHCSALLNRLILLSLVLPFLITVLLLTVSAARYE